MIFSGVNEGTRKRKSLGKVHFLVENKAKKTDKRLLRDVEVPWEILL